VDNARLVPTAMKLARGALLPVRAPLRSLADRVPALPTLAGYVAFKLRHTEALSPYRSGEPDLIAQIKRDGFAVIHGYKSAEFCRSCVEAIESIIADEPQHVENENDQRIFGAEEVSDIFAPFHEDAWLQALSDDYSCAKTVNAFTLASRVSPEHWTTPDDGGWHRDLRYRQFKAFLYLDEVTLENGPFQIVRDSHRPLQHLIDVQTGPLPFVSSLFVDAQIERIVRRDPSRLIKVLGGPGTLILADTGTLHRGSPPKRGVRYALTNYYMEKEYVAPSITRYKLPNPDKLRRLLADWPQ
jgi:hypothetical protein